MSRSRLLELPEELLAPIAEFVQTGDLLNFALTCRTTYYASKKRLSRNVILAQGFGTLSDLSPLTVPAALARIQARSDAAWHLQAFEIWETRIRFNQWKTSSVMTDENQSPPDPNTAQSATREIPDTIIPLEKTITQDITSLTDVIDVSMIETIKNVIHHELGFPPDESRRWVEKALIGDDEPLKGVIFALSPRLDRLNFIAHNTTGGGGELINLNPLIFLCSAIANVHLRARQQTHISWPPGFRSLRMVSVCNSTDLRHPHDAFYCQPHTISPLFLLPNIKVLNLTLLGYTGDDEEDFELAPRSSAIEVLRFSCVSINKRSWQKFLQAPVKLVHFTVFHSSIDPRDDNHNLKELLLTEHAATIEILEIDRTEFYALEDLRKFKRLAELDHLPLGSFLFEQPDSNVAWKKARDQGFRIREDPQSGTEIYDLRDFLPTSLKRLGFRNDYVFSPTPLRGRDALLRAVVDLVEDDRFQQLCEVCLNALYPRTIWRENGPDGPWNAEAVQRIEERGIKTHLRDDEGVIMQYSQHRLMHPDGNMGLARNETEPVRQTE